MDQICRLSSEVIKSNYALTNRLRKAKTEIEKCNRILIDQRRLLEANMANRGSINDQLSRSSTCSNSSSNKNNNFDNNCIIIEDDEDDGADKAEEKEQTLS